MARKIIRNIPKSVKVETSATWAKKQDWVKLKEEFFTTLNASGNYLYRSAAGFAKAKYPNDKLKCRWLNSAIISEAKQGIWVEERLMAGTVTDRQCRDLRQKIQSELNILEVGKQVAESYLPLQKRIFDMYTELESRFGNNVLNDLVDDKGKPFTDDASYKNLARFITALTRIVSLKVTVDNQFLRSLGWERPQFIAYVQQLKIAAQSNGKDAPDKSLSQVRVEGMMAELVRNQIEKAKMYGLPLPEDIQELAAEAEQPPVQEEDE